MSLYETPLERAQRQVIEAEVRLATQVAWIADMKRQYYDTKYDEVVLTVLKDRLESFYGALAHLRARAVQ
jgi:hypothetical protein